MRKLLCGLICVLLAQMSFGLTGCGGGVDNESHSEKVDPTKIQLNVGIFDGGLGDEWMTRIKNRFEADFADYQIQTRTREMTKRLSSMYSLVSRRNIKAEEKEKRLKEMILPCLDDCRVMSTTSAGVKGVIHDGYSDDYDAYYIFRGEAIDQLRAEEEGKNE